MQQNAKNSYPNLPIAKIRQIVPNTIAQAIINVQPMSMQPGYIFAIGHENSKISEWTKTFVIRPRKTIEGSYVIGRVNRRTIEIYVGGELNHPRYKSKYQYATDMEVFKLTLKGEKDAITV